MVQRADPQPDAALPVAHAARAARRRHAAARRAPAAARARARPAAQPVSPAIAWISNHWTERLMEIILVFPFFHWQY